jgi:chromosome segregation ATPase
MLDNDLKDALTAILKAELSPVIERLDGIESRLDGMDSRLDKMDSKLGQMESRLDKVDAKLDQMESKLDRIESEQTQIKQAVLETNEIVKRLEVVQDQQATIINLLSARSLLHEAKLQRIV